MKKFCTNCGKPLDENGKCTCAGQVNSEGSIFNTILELVKNMLKKPVDTLKDNVNGEYKNGCIFIAIAGVISALFSVVYLKETIKAVSINPFIGSLLGVADINYFKIFFIVLLCGVAVYMVEACMIYLVSSKLFKNNTDIKQTINLVGFSLIPTIVCTILSTILVFISQTIAIIVLAISSLVSTYNLYSGIKFISKDENNNAYLLTTSIICTCVIVYIVLRIFS